MYAKFANKEQVKRLLEGGAMLVDMRSPVAYRNGSINGAVNLPLRNFLNTLSGLNRDTKLIVFGDSNEDADVNTGINYAAQLGFNIYISEYSQLVD